MPARAMWKGRIRLGDTAGVPVKLYAAVEDTAIHFHLLHARDGVRVEQRIVHPETGDAVPPSSVRRGYPWEPGVFVVLDEQELEALEPKPSREIEVVCFLAPETIAPVWFERPYHLGPDGSAASYSALAAALHRHKRQGLVQWTMRKRRYHGALRSDGSRLSLITLRDQDEVLQAPELELPKVREPSAQELKLAQQLLSTLSGRFEPSAFRSEYRQRVHELVERKANGETIEPAPAARRKASGESLESVLRASVKHARPAHKERKSA
jgi:DNA end-binding protein Ku